jgi:hypothetical protein
MVGDRLCFRYAIYQWTVYDIKRSDVAVWHFSVLTDLAAMSVIEGKADLPVERPDF